MIALEDKWAYLHVGSKDKVVISLFDAQESKVVAN